MVHVTEDPDLKVMATASPPRGGLPAHLLRYRPGTRAVDYLVAYQMLFLVRLFSCPQGERWEVGSTPSEEAAGIAALGLADFPHDFSLRMLGTIIIQVRTCSVGYRIDAWIRENLPGLRDQQEHAIRSQLAENERVLAPDTRSKFPKALVDANTVMNAVFATSWGRVFREPRLAIPFTAMGYGAKAAQLLAILEDTPDDPVADRALIEGWAKALGLVGTFHFQPYTTT
jgi:hypothetical protein